jgi:hypothetical protein
LKLEKLLFPSKLNYQDFSTFKTLNAVIGSILSNHAATSEMHSPNHQAVYGGLLWGRVLADLTT